MDLIRVTNENIHTILPKYVEDNSISINEIDDMIETYMDMVKNNHLFLIDRELLKDLLVVFNLNPFENKRTGTKIEKAK